ncbi:MAG: hypothetical protein N3D75_03295 [Candidatus Aenigmarchaeota archaeon]|nr:hypothetical protein [Candidatus Aenigmarchaeota archaeon]
MGKMKIFALIFFISIAFAQTIDEQFKQINGYDWAVETYDWGYISSAAKQRPNEFFQEINQEQAIIIANDFLLKNAKFFGVERINYTDSAKIVDIEKKYSWVVVYQGQMFEGLPIVDTHTTVIMTSDGQIYAVGNLRYYFQEDENLIEGISQNDAIEAAKEHLGTDSEPDKVSRLIKVDEESNFDKYITWNISYNCPIGSDVFVDANGNVISQENKICAENKKFNLVFIILILPLVFFATKILNKIKRKGILFGFMLVVISLSLITLLIIQKNISYKNYQRSYIESRIHDMNNLYESIVFDLSKAVDIITKRAISTAVSEIITTGQPIENPNEKLKELVFFGTINGQEKQLMQNSTIQDWISRINFVGDQKNYNISVSFNEFEIMPYDSFNLNVKGTISLNITDKNNIASIKRFYNFSEKVSIEGFEDPLYVLSTEGKATKIIKKTKYQNNYTILMGECSPSRDWSYGEVFLGYTYSQINQVANKSNKILFLEDSSVADPSLVNQFSGVISTDDISYLVNVPFCENTTLYIQLYNGQNVLLDSVSGKIWYIDNFLEHYRHGYYSPSLKGPSFFDRMEGKKTIQSKHSSIFGAGLESFIDKDYFDSIDIVVKDDTNVDYLYFNSSYFSSAKIKGLPTTFKLDNEPSFNDTHRNYYGVINLTI